MLNSVCSWNLGICSSLCFLRCLLPDKQQGHTSTWNAESTLNHLHNLTYNTFTKESGIIHDVGGERREGAGRTKHPPCTLTIWERISAGVELTFILRAVNTIHGLGSSLNSFLNFPILMYWCLSSNFFSTSMTPLNQLTSERSLNCYQNETPFKNAFIFRANHFL